MFARGAAVQSALIASETDEGEVNSMFDAASASLHVCPVPISLQTGADTPPFVGHHYFGNIRLLHTRHRMPGALLFALRLFAALSFFCFVIISSSYCVGIGMVLQGTEGETKAREKHWRRVERQTSLLSRQRKANQREV